MNVFKTKNAFLTIFLFIFSDLETEPAQRVYPEDGASSVADEHVQDPMVPPALGEVSELVLKGVFKKLKHNRDHWNKDLISMAEVSNKI